jgi:hypothetical protein
MRGERYDTTWKKQVVNALDRGLEVNTLSVFNKSIQFDGYQNTLSPLGIRKTVCAPVFDMLVPLMSIELINISLPIKNTEPSSA